MASNAGPVPLTAPPADGQSVEHDGKVYTTKQEGLAYILIPPGTQTSVDPRAKKADGAGPKPQTVFYNPIQQFNRDLSVLAIKAFGDDWLERKRQSGIRRKDKLQKKQERCGERKGKKRKLEQLEGVEDTVQQANDGESSAKMVRNEDNALHDQDAGQMTETIVPSAPASAADAAVREDQSPLGQTNPPSSTDGLPVHLNGHYQPSGPRFRILDALSASGLRALRYAKEIPFVTSVVANDMSPNAIQSMKMNIQHNHLSHLITSNTGDAIGHMYSVAHPPTHSHGPTHINQRYDVIDLDPYGTAVPFIDAALQALNDGGLLCVTCTDSGVFASCGYSEKAYSLYGGLPIRGLHMHEGGLRLIIHSVATTAAKYGIAIEPLLSLSIDFYARVFIRIRKSAADVKFLSGKTMLVYGCDAGCGAWVTQMLGRNARQPGKSGNPDWFKHSAAQAPAADRVCEHCGSKTHVAGPMWAGPLHNNAFVEKMLADVESVDQDIYHTRDRVEGMLTTAREELLVNDEVTRYVPVLAEAAGDTAHPSGGPPVQLIPRIPPDVIDPHPFFVQPSALAKVIHCVAPGDVPFKGALRHAGYRATRSHCQAGSVKTDAPWSFIWHVMREWARQRYPIREGKLKENTPGWGIMRQAAAVATTTTTTTTPHDVPAPSDRAPASAATETGLARVTAEAGDGPSADVPSCDDQGGRRAVVFDEALGRDRPGKKLVRYQQNPRENWGPMARAKGS